VTRISPETWNEANQRHLVAAIEVVRARVHALLAGGDGADDALRAAAEERDAAAAAAPSPTALEVLTAAFALTPFERDLLLAAAAAELDADVGRLFAEAQGDPQRTRVSFALAQALFDEPHWSALSPGRPLRALRLVEVGAGPLPTAPVGVVERVLHHLLGVGGIDERLQAWLAPLPPAGTLPDSHAEVAARLGALWAEPLAPTVQLLGPHAADRLQVLAAASEQAGRRLWRVAAAEIPADPSERDDWLRLVQRELLLDGSGLVVELQQDPAPGVGATLRRVGELAGLLVLSGEAPHALDRPTAAMEVPRLRRAEQRELWRRGLGGDAPEDVLAGFDLAAAEIAGLAATAADGDLWDAARRQTRPELEGHATRVRSRATIADLVLPDEQLDAVRAIVAHAPHRFAVAERFDATERGHGLVALFSGPSGTGKTLAAEAIANELSLDLFRVDLASVVSKWVGETEKHLRAILDAADRGSSVLLFDEADALFGKRGEVRESQDRFANIEVGYLLQRLEAYRGIALLTTNLRSALDTAFTRRIRYVVQFPHPETSLRARIWRGVFPESVDVAGLDFDRLALLDLTGGSIHNIAVHAALDAAAAGGPVTVEHVRRATVREYAKLDRPLTRTEAVGLE
jgi:ATPase family associated with various cellular activities (AAA)/Winged helix domain, variant